MLVITWVFAHRYDGKLVGEGNERKPETRDPRVKATSCVAGLHWAASILSIFLLRELDKPKVDLINPVEQSVSNNSTFIPLVSGSDMNLGAWGPLIICGIEIRFVPPGKRSWCLVRTLIGHECNRWEFSQTAVPGVLI